MKFIKLFENFNNEVHYTVNKVGNVYRIYAQTPKMKSNNEQHEDCETLFGKGSFWKDYNTYSDAKSVVDSLSKPNHDEFEDEEVED